MRFLTLALLLALASASFAANRTWTDRQGRTFVGELIEMEGAEAKIRRSGDEASFVVRVESLSDADQAYLLRRMVLEQPAEEDTEGATNEFRVERFRVTVEGGHPTQVRLWVRYNHRIVWEGTASVPGQVDLTIHADTDFNEEPRPGSVADETIYLYISSDTYASQWHRLQRSGGRLVFRDDKNIRLYRKKYVIVEYAFFQGDDPEFAGRTPTFSGVAAVGHWGSLPGFRSDWQVWQGSSSGGRWGNEILLQHHRGTESNGFRPAPRQSFDRMLQAPRSGYQSFGTGPQPHQMARKGEAYYSRVSGHSESTSGYGKIFIRDIVETVPAGVEVLEQ
jgi:hypothetical protein